MKPHTATYLIRHKLSGLLMIAMLLWLTVSTPFIYSYQQGVKKEAAKQAKEKTDDTNPLTTTNEEKSENGVNTLSEYLHEIPLMEPHFIILSSFFKCHSSDLYFAFHPDTISPPPDLA